MVKLKSFPDAATISALRGRIDFYWWKGIPVARAWPRYTKPIQSEALTTNQTRFAAVAKVTGMVDGEVRLQWETIMAGSEGVSWFDGWRATALGNPWVVEGGS